jgi:heme oxygenase (biliverdin-IX-beta and delta-forming)
MSEVEKTVAPFVLAQIRAVTRSVHERLEHRLDAIKRFSDPLLRIDLIQRFAAFYLPAKSALAGHLMDIRDLDFMARSRRLVPYGLVGNRPLPNFPAPETAAEALGMLYVLEGSTLCARVILRTLSDLDVEVSDLAFLDPYGVETGSRWRSFLLVLERETSGDHLCIEHACRGAVVAFEHAESVLCEGLA